MQLIPTREEISRRYDLGIVEADIVARGLSRHAQHLLNETLWREDCTSSGLLVRGLSGVRAALSRTSKHVRPEARCPDVVDEVVRSFR